MMTNLEMEREAIFQSAHRYNQYNNLRYGRMPTCEELTGKTLNKEAIAKVLTKALQGKLKRSLGLGG